MRIGIGIGLATSRRFDVPSLDLDFTQGVLPPGLTFTRASTATYIGSDGLLKTAAVDQPRFDYDPVTLACKGLLIEGTRTNMMIRASEMDSAAWGKTNATVVANSIEAPFGLTHDIIETAVSGTHGIAQGVNQTAGTVYTASIHAKAKGRSLMRFGTGDGYVIFDLAAGVVQHSDAGCTGIISPLGGGRYRCIVTQTSSTTASVAWLVRSQSSTAEWPGSGVYTGDGVSGLTVGRAQIEAGSFATSYIPTTTVAVTRAADSAPRMAGANFSNWFNPDEGTIVVEASLLDTGTNRGVYDISDGTVANEYFHYATTATHALVNSGGVSQGNSVQFGVIAANTVYRHAFAYKANDLIGATNGALSAADSSIVLPAVNRLTLGSRVDASFKLEGHPPLRLLPHPPVQRRFAEAVSMTDYIDAILHIADVPGMIGALPPEIVADGVVVGIARTPMTMQGVSGLVYVRMTPEEAAQWRGTPGVTILGEAPYTGQETADVVYADAMAHPLYAAVYDPQSVVMEDGTVIQPPQWFGVLA